MLSQSRIEELLDYATVYGDWDENTPNGEVHPLSLEPMNDSRRSAISTLKRVLELTPFLPDVNREELTNGQPRY